MRTLECGLAPARVRVPLRLGVVPLTCEFQSNKSECFQIESTEECLEIAQSIDYIGRVVFLEHADGSDTGGSGFEAGAGVGESHSA